MNECDIGAVLCGVFAGVVCRSKEIRNMWGGAVKGSSKVI